MHRPEEIPATITAFRNLDYTDQGLYKSGLFKDAMESHFWLLENSGIPLDSVFIEMSHSIDAMMVKLVKDEQKLNEVTLSVRFIGAPQLVSSSRAFSPGSVEPNKLHRR